MSWIVNEFSDISFGDKRLDERFHKIAEALVEKPSGSMSAITGDWGETKAGYRLFANEKVSRDEMGPPFKQNSRPSSKRGTPLVMSGLKKHNLYQSNSSENFREGREFSRS